MKPVDVAWAAYVAGALYVVSPLPDVRPFLPALWQLLAWNVLLHATVVVFPALHYWTYYGWYHILTVTALFMFHDGLGPVARHAPHLLFAVQTALFLVRLDPRAHLVLGPTLLLLALQPEDLYRPGTWCLGLYYVSHLFHEHQRKGFSPLTPWLWHLVWLRGQGRSWDLASVVALGALRLFWRVQDAPQHFDWAQLVRFPHHLPHLVFVLALLHVERTPWYLAIPVVMDALVYNGRHGFSATRSSPRWTFCVDVL